MPNNKYLQVLIDQKKLDLYSVEDFPIGINYALEDAEDFQTKVSAEALSVKYPATPNNDKIFNLFSDPSMEDMTADQIFRNMRKSLIVANGIEIFAGQCILTNASHTSCPTEYEVDHYGNNGDWIIGLKDATLYDFLKQIEFTFTQDLVEDSWAFDGTNENLPYVFAPVRYGVSMDGIYLPNPGNQNPAPVQADYNMTTTYMRPSLSVYWILYWGFKSIGYKIKSDFFNTDYFRRAVMPWTWGNFLDSEGTQLDVLKFLAKSAGTNDYWFRNNFFGFVDLNVTNDSASPAFDNDNTYEYIAGNQEMRWTYPGGFGPLNVQLKLSLSINSTVRGGAIAQVNIHWYKNGVEDVSKLTTAMTLAIAGVGRKDYVSLDDYYQMFLVEDPGDYISCRVEVNVQRTEWTGSGNVVLNVEAFDFEYSTIPLGGTINFANYIGFQKWKFLDLFAGIIDAFNLVVQADPINKVLYAEPQYPYALGNDLSVKQPGYFTGETQDWNRKQDLLKTSVLNLFKDYSRQLTFKFKDDSADGILKTIQDRYTVVLAQSNYVLPQRFKDEQKTIENRFFSPTMHYPVAQWQQLQDASDDPVPQMIVMAPENISNTSHSEAQNTFQPKLCWYKGMMDGTGWHWLFERTIQTSFPYMFAVNYKAGGENDPVFSYSDENIAGVVAKGLLKRFYWNRMAIMRNGQYYTTYFKLKTTDILNWLHREHIVCKGQRWELVNINNYLPTHDESTEVNMRKWVPVAQEDLQNTYPTSNNVLNGVISNSTYETKYYPLMGLPTDIPQTDAPVDPGLG